MDARPELKAPKSVKKCEDCGKGFGITRKRTNCYACGGVFCRKKCTTQKVLSELGYDEEMAVCMPCASGATGAASGDGSGSAGRAKATTTTEPTPTSSSSAPAATATASADDPVTLGRLGDAIGDMTDALKGLRDALNASLQQAVHETKACGGVVKRLCGEVNSLVRVHRTEALLSLGEQLQAAAVQLITWAKRLGEDPSAAKTAMMNQIKVMATATIQIRNTYRNQLEAAASTSAATTSTATPAPAATSTVTATPPAAAEAPETMVRLPAKIANETEAVPSGRRPKALSNAQDVARSRRRDTIDLDDMMSQFADISEGLDTIEATAATSGAGELAIDSIASFDAEFKNLLSVMDAPEFDMADNVYTKCYFCSQPVPDSEKVDLGGRSYHSNCLRCSRCGSARNQCQDDFKDENGSPFCLPCWIEGFTPVCKECGEHILDEMCVAVSLGIFHTGCFLCIACGEPQVSDDYVHEANVYCKKDFFAVMGMACALCTKPIEGKCKTYKGDRFHKACFLCSFCKQPLESFVEHDDQPFCRNCHLRLH